MNRGILKISEIHREKNIFFRPILFITCRLCIEAICVERVELGLEKILLVWHSDQISIFSLKCKFKQLLFLNWTLPQNDEFKCQKLITKHHIALLNGNILSHMVYQHWTHSEKEKNQDKIRIGFNDFLKKECSFLYLIGTFFLPQRRPTGIRKGAYFFTLAS